MSKMLEKLEKLEVLTDSLISSRKKLYEALLAVEWVRGMDGSNYCPWCRYIRHEGHSPICQRQAALRSAEGK